MSYEQTQMIHTEKEKPLNTSCTEHQQQKVMKETNHLMIFVCLFYSPTCILFNFVWEFSFGRVHGFFFQHATIKTQFLYGTKENKRPQNENIVKTAKLFSANDL